MKSKMILLFAILLGLSAAFGTYKYLSDLEAKYKITGEFIDIVEATKKIPAKTVIESSMVITREVPLKYAPYGAMKKDEVIGKIAKYDILPGQIIQKDLILDKKDPAAGLSAKIEPGKRAISIPVNNVVALNGLLSSGDRVDVIVTFDAPPDKKITVTSTIIQNVPVLAVDASLNAQGQSKTEPKTVTLMVTPEEAQQLAFAVQHGSIHLTLRSPQDTGKIPLNSTKAENLLR